MTDTANTEAALIGVILADVPGVLPVAMAAGVRVGWFSTDPWGVVWLALERVWRDGGADKADAVSVFELAKKIAADPEIKISAARLTAESISAAVSNAEVGGYAESHIAALKSAYIERRIRRAMAEHERLFASTVDAAEVGVAMRTALDSVLADAIDGKKINKEKIMDEITTESETAYQKRIVEKNLDWTPGYRMPWDELTRQLNGLRPGLHVVAARPSVGKTAFAVNLMRFWCELGIHVSLNQLDMPRVEMMRRFVAEQARVSLRKSLFSPTRTDIDAMRAAGEAVAKWPLAVTEIRDVDDFRTYCMVEHAAGRLEIVVCDYLQLFHSRALGREDAVEYARVSYVSDTLKRLANELGVPVVALCQLNRESAKTDQQGREPGLADLRGSGSIEQDAFTVALLHRDKPTVDLWNTPGHEPRQFIPGGMEPNAQIYGAEDVDAVWWILCKSQNGATGKFPFVARKKYFAWMLGDYAARPLLKEEGAGATKRTVEDNSLKFARVHSDWRHDPLEAALRQNGALIEPPPPKQETFNAVTETGDWR